MRLAKNKEDKSINKVTIHPDGSLKVADNLLDQIGQETDAMIYKTDYGFKIISLVPDIKKVYIEVTTLCNFDCTTCIRNSWEEDLGKMDANVFIELLNQLKELPELECVHFGGFGEPLSHPDIFQMIASVKQMGVRVEMITNGSLLNENNARKLIDLGLDRLFISLDGPDEEVYNDIRQGADYNSVIENIHAFNRLKDEKKTKKPELAIEFVAMKKNIHKLPQVVSLLKEIKARYLLVTNVLPYSEDMKDEIIYDIDDTVPLFGKDSLMVSVRAHMPDMKLRTERYCKFIQDKAVTVTRDGNIAPCYALMHQYTCYIYGRKKNIKPYHLGNIKNRSIKDIWTDTNYACFRASVNEFKFPSCTDCRLLDGCSYTYDNEMDCWGNSPSCAECLWARGIVVCP